MMNPDMELVREFAAHNSERAFETLVARHIDLVHSAALRQTGDPHQAEEITQAVFIILARKAASLRDKTILPGWLYRTTRFTAANLRRAQINRHRREQGAYMLSQSPETETAWHELSPLLDEAMERLGKTDRNAIILRYFQNKNLQEVGNELGIAERAAQKRVARGLEKLRVYFSKRGVALSATAIAGAVSLNSAKAAPATLTKIVTAVAISKGTAASGSTLTHIKGALKLMAWSKAKIVVISVTGILALGVTTTTVAVKEYKDHRTYSWQTTEATFSTLYDTPPQVVIVPAKFGKRGNWCSDGGVGATGIGQTLEKIIPVAYGMNEMYVVMKTTLPTNRYDYFAKLAPARKPHENPKSDPGWREAFQKEIKRKFGIVAHKEKIDTEVLLLKPIASGVKNFVPSHSMPNGLAIKPGPGDYSFYEQPIGTLKGVLENRYAQPILDRSGLKGEYDYALKWNEPNLEEPNAEGFKAALAEQLGLELIATNMPIEKLIVVKQ